MIDLKHGCVYSFRKYEKCETKMKERKEKRTKGK